MKKIITIISIALISLFLVGCEKKEKQEKKYSEKIVTNSGYDKIKNGMSYGEVKKILNTEGKLYTEAGEKGKTGYTTVYLWDVKGKTGSHITVTFVNNKVIAKNNSEVKKEIKKRQK